MPGGWDDEDPYGDGEYIPVRVYWDEWAQKWKCRCYSWTRYGKCAHLVRYRRTVELRVKEEYL